MAPDTMEKEAQMLIKSYPSDPSVHTSEDYVDVDG